MIVTDEEALICDLAEIYHIFDYRSMPARMVATLAAGLPDSSRIKLKIAGIPCATETLLLAMAVDRLSLLFWAKTEDGQKNRNRPESIYLHLLGVEERKKQDEIMTFDTGADFDAAWKRIVGGGT